MLDHLALDGPPPAIATARLGVSPTIPPFAATSACARHSRFAAGPNRGRGVRAGRSQYSFIVTPRGAARAVVRIGGVETLGGFRVRLSLTDGSTREVDLGPYLNGPAFEPVRGDPVFFRSVRVDEDLGTIVWPNGADIDPDVLILGRMPASFEAAGGGSRAG